MDSLSSVANGAPVPGVPGCPCLPASGSAPGFRLVLMPFRCDPFTDRSCTSLLLSGIRVNRRQNLQHTHCSHDLPGAMKVMLIYYQASFFRQAVYISSCVREVKLRAHQCLLNTSGVSSMPKPLVSG